MGVNVLGVNVFKFELSPTVDPVTAVRNLFVDKRTKRLKRRVIAASAGIASLVPILWFRRLRRPVQHVIQIVIVSPVARAIGRGK